MKQVSPARLTQPLLRKPGSERGAGEFEAISWERAYELLTERLRHIRATDPKKFALFTGRDQMQALTGLFARQFGTPNYAAHGGFCSVNMAAGMIYTIGGSFWEFGGPDLDRAKLFVMIGTAEDHHSNPMKIALSKFKRAGGRFISDQPDPHRLFGHRRRVDPHQARHRRRAVHGAAARADPHRHAGPRLPEALHQRAAAGGAGRRRARGPVRLRPRPRQGPARRRPPPAQQAGVGQGVGPRAQRLPRRHRRRLRPGARRPLHAGRRHARRALVPAAARARRELHARMGRGDHRHPGRAHPQAGLRDGPCRADAGLRAADPVDRRLGQAAPDARRRGRWPSMRCAGWRRIPTASRPCARWPC